MKMSYNRLWKLLIDKNMKKSALREKAKISSSSLAKLNKGENVTTEVILRICEALDCRVEDIMEAVPATSERPINETDKSTSNSCSTMEENCNGR